jgi:hypothetical protein
LASQATIEYVAPAPAAHPNAIANNPTRAAILSGRDIPLLLPLMYGPNSQKVPHAQIRMGVDEVEKFEGIGGE